MITLNQIREIIINQDKELEDIILKYLIQNSINNEKKIESTININLYKKSVKENIERLISENKLNEAKKLVEEYKTVVKDDISIYSMEGIILLQENDLHGAYISFKNGINLDKTNVDLLYNMAYTNILLGSVDEGINYYKQCLKLTEDETLINEINNIINQLVENSYNQNYTFITMGISSNDIIFNQLKTEGNNVIKIIENNELQYENKYEKDDMTIYEANSKNYNDILEYIIRRNENCIIICSDIYKLDFIMNLKEQFKIIYYTNNNFYVDKSNYLNHSIDMYLEKEICNNCDLILTNNISVYTTKKIIEERDNVYLFEENSDEIFDITYILKNNKSINKTKIEENLKGRLRLIQDEYEKSLYLLASEHENIENCIQISKYIYEKYDTEEIYQIYLNLLNQKSDYVNLAALAINSKYCNDIFKVELIYLNSVEDYDLMGFIVNISIKNYKKIDEMSDINVEYKMATYNFELNKFDIAYSKYINVLDDNIDLVNSPLVNRNVGYIMYANGNDEYERFYKVYKEIINCLDESDDVKHEG